MKHYLSRAMLALSSAAAIIAASCSGDPAFAQVINPSQPATGVPVAGTGISVAGQTVSVNYGLVANTSLQGNALHAPTAIGDTTPNTAAFTTLSATGAVSGAGFSSLFASPFAIGSTAPNTGAFTTLSASSTISGTGFSTYLASPPAIGGTVPAAGSFTNLSTTGTVNFGTANITAGYLSPLSNAVSRTLATKLGDVVSVADFGCDLTGVASSSTCFNNALATGKDVYIPAGTYKLTTLVTSSTFNQNIYGAGRASSLIQCTLTASGNCILFTGSSGNQSLRDVSVTTGNTNTVKLIQVQSPQLRIIDTYMQNTASAGTVIYCEDESNPIFTFGLQLIANTFTGAGSASTSTIVRLGVNAQTALIKNDIIVNAQTGILINGSNEASVIEDDVIENLQTGVSFVSSGTMPLWAISIRKNYFEAILSAAVSFGGTGGVFSNIDISSNYGTSGGGTVYFISATNPSVNGLTNGNKFENNYIQNFTAAFNLVDGVIGQSAASFKGNTLDATAYATGTNSINAYQTRVINPYFSNVLVSGAFTSKGVNRMEMSAGDYQVPLRIDPHEYVENVQFRYLAVGTTSMTATLYKLLNTSDTPVSVSTATGTTTGTYTLAYGGYAAANTQYYVEIVMTLNGGTTGYVYPLTENIRQ